MKKSLLIVAVFILSAATLTAQEKNMSSSKKTSLELGANLGTSTNSGAGFTYGGDLQLNIRTSELLKVTVSGGIEEYTISGGGNGYIIPLFGGLKYNFSPKVYGHAQLGYGFAQGGGGAFAYAPSVGYNASSNFDISLKFLGFSNNGFTLGALLLRFAYNFGK